MTLVSPWQWIHPMMSMLLAIRRLRIFQQQVLSRPRSVGFLVGQITNTDAFVAKLQSGGASLIYSSFLGGNGIDSGSAIAVDSAGNAYVTGETQSLGEEFSSDFPVKNAIQTNNGGGFGDAYVAKVKLNPNISSDLSITKADSPDPINALGKADVYAYHIEFGPPKRF